MANTKLNMKEHKTVMNITEKLNCTSAAKHRITMNITEKLIALLEKNTKQNTTTL